MTTADLERLLNGTLHICVEVCPAFEDSLTLFGRLLCMETQIETDYVDVVLSYSTVIRVYPTDRVDIGPGVLDKPNSVVVSYQIEDVAISTYIYQALWKLNNAMTVGISARQSIRRYSTLTESEREDWREWVGVWIVSIREKYQSFRYMGDVNQGLYLMSFMRNEVHRCDCLSPIVAALIFPNGDCWRYVDGRLRKHTSFADSPKNAAKRK